MLSPNYALASQVAEDDPEIEVGYQEYNSPDGAGDMRAYMAVPAGASGKIPGVVVIHENRGLNPYIEDVARRVAKAGFIGFAPDALTPLGGYPGNDDEGRTMQRERDRDEMFEDSRRRGTLPSGASKVHRQGRLRRLSLRRRCFQCPGRSDSGSCSGRAVYGRQVASGEVDKINAPLLIHYGELDTRVNEGWPDYKEALDESGKNYTMQYVSWR